MGNASCGARLTQILNIRYQEKKLATLLGTQPLHILGYIAG
jgi:hypothetical protein